MKLLIIVYLSFFSLIANSGTWNIELGYAPLGEYSYDSTNLSYDADGISFNITHHFMNSTSSVDSFSFYWGAGLGYSSLNMELDSGTSLATEFKLANITPKILGGIKFSGYYIEFPFGFSYTEETSGPFNGDLKYGLSYGIQIRRNFFTNFYATLDYSISTYDKGKNAATGVSGSLTNKVNLSHWGILVGYTFSLGGLSSY